jgi:hypothetical protein
MKTTFIILICLPFFATAQNKKDNAIIIHDTISNKTIKEVLFSEGYDLNRNDSDFISTQPKYLKGSSIKISFQKRDSVWIAKAFGKDNITAYVLLPGMNVDYAQVYYGGMKGSPVKDLWNEFNKIATALSNKIEYVKQ